MGSGDLQESGGRILAKCVIGLTQVTGGRTRISGNWKPLSMVEDIKGFRAELEAHALGNFEVFKEGHVEVGPVGVVQAVSSRVAESQAAWQSVGVRVVNLGSQFAWKLCDSCIRITYFVGTRGRADSVGHAGIISRNDDAEWRSGLEAGNAGELPPAENFISKTRAFEERQIPNVGEVQDVPLVEVGTRAI